MTTITRGITGKLRSLLETLRYWLHSYDVAFEKLRLSAVFDRYALDEDKVYRKWALHLPDRLCYLRIFGGLALVPLLYVAFAQHAHGWAIFWSLIIIAMMVTDLVDGPLARRMGLHLLKKPVGRFNGGSLDAVADKCLMIPMFLMTAVVSSHLSTARGESWYVQVAIIAVITDTLLMGITIMESKAAAKVPHLTHLRPKAGQAGKWKVHFQGAGVFLATFAALEPWRIGGISLIWVAAACLVSGVLLSIESIDGHLKNLLRLRHHIWASKP